MNSTHQNCLILQYVIYDTLQYYCNHLIGYFDLPATTSLHYDDVLVQIPKFFRLKLECSENSKENFNPSVSYTIKSQFPKLYSCNILRQNTCICPHRDI